LVKDCEVLVVDSLMEELELTHALKVDYLMKGTKGLCVCVCVCERERERETLATLGQPSQLVRGLPGDGGGHPRASKTSPWSIPTGWLQTLTNHSGSVRRI
jgi:hypothetical protein